MSKVLRTVSKVAGVIATVAMFVPGGQPIAAIASAVSTVTAVGAQLTAKPPRAKGQTSSITIGANQPIPYMIGRSYSGGAMIHDVGWGGIVDKVENPYRAMTMVYSGAGPIHALVATQADFTDVSFSGTAATGYYAGFLWRDWLDGSGPAPRALAAQWAGEPSWTSTHRLSGFFAAKYSLRFDKKGQAWQAGVPQFGIIADGVRVYDPRFDSTYPGGTGAQRIGNEGTYAFSKNPAAHALTYAYGRYQNGKKIFGLGSSVQAIDLANIVAWANLCDANGWEVNGTIYEPGDRWNNLKLIAAAGGAVPVVTAGVLRFDYAAPVVSLDTLTVDDLGEGEISVPATQAFADKLNTVTGSYTSPAHRWEEVPTDRISDAGYLTADGEEKAEAFAFPLVTNKDQAARLAAYKLVESREIGPIQLPAKARFMRYPVGSAFTLNLPPLGLVGQVVKVKGRSVNPLDGTVELTLMTETAGKHAFALGRTTTAPPAPVLVTPQQLDGLALSSFELTQDPDTLTIGEKIQAVIPKENARSGTNGRYPTVRARMVALGLSVTALDTASANWLAHRNGITTWNNTGVHSTIIRTTWDSLSKAFDDALNLGDIAISEEDARRAIIGTGVTDKAGNPVAIEHVRNNLALIDWWRKGATIPWTFNNESNSIVSVPADASTVQPPTAGQADVWFCQEVTGDGEAGGGWGGAPIAPLDPDKAYRFLLPVRRLTHVVHPGPVAGAYWGVTDVANLNTTTLNTNPYFAVYNRGTMVDDRWYLFVGYIFPRNSIGKNSDSAGVWDCKTGLKVGTGLNFCFMPAGTQPTHRAYQFYAGIGSQQMMGMPLIEPIERMSDMTLYFEESARLNNAIGVNGSGQFVNPVGTGNGTTIANNQIAVNGSGQIAGIGTGNLTEVGNDRLDLAFDTSGTAGRGRALLRRSGGTVVNSTVQLPAALQNIDQQWADVNSRPANLSALAGTEAIQNTLITINGSGQVAGIGTGNLTEVGNDRLDLAFDTSGVGGRGRALLRRAGGTVVNTTIELPATLQNIDQQWSQVNSRPANLSGLTGTEAIQNTLITVNASGQVSGIGTGNLTEVGNDRLDIAFDTSGVGGRGRALLRRSGGTVVNATVQLPAALQNIDQQWNQVNSRPLLITGDAITADELLLDPSVWNPTSLSFLVDTDGTGYVEAPSGVAQNLIPRFANATPIDRSATYEAEWEFLEAGSGSPTSAYYTVVLCWDAAGADIGGDGTYWFYPSAFTTNVGRGSYERRLARFGKGTARPFPANAVKFGVGILLNYNASAVVTRARRIRARRIDAENLGINGDASRWQIGNNSAIRWSGAGGWNQTVARSKSTLAGAQSLSFDLVSPLAMCGLTDAANPAGFADLDYAWYCETGGVIQIYESGTNVWSTTGYTNPDDVRLRIDYDGNIVRYFINGGLARSIVAGAGRSFRVGVDCNTVGAGFRNIRHIPIESNAYVGVNTFDSVGAAWTAENGATIGARAGTNLRRANNTVVGDAEVLNENQQWNQVNSRPANLSGLTGTEAIQNTLITVNASGQVSGIGTGNLTEVGNDRLDIAFDTSGTGGRGRALLRRAGGTVVNATVQLPAALQNLDQQWSEVNARPANLSALAGTEAIQNTLITIASGALNGIGTGTGTVVANNQITVSGGNIAGIGTGNNTEVANDRLDIVFDTAGTGGRGRAQLRRAGGTVVNSTVQLPATLQNIDQQWSEVQAKDVWLTDSRIPNGLDTAGRNQIGIVAGGGNVHTNPEIMGTVNGTNIATNPEFIDGTTTGYGVYNNAGGTRVTMAVETDQGAPNASGFRLAITYDGTGTPDSNPTPGFGGVVQFLQDSVGGGFGGRAVPGRYARNSTILFSIIALIPTGRSIWYASNSIGNEGAFEWLTDTAGTSAWKRYVLRVKTGWTGSFSSTGFIYVGNGPNSAFTWYLAKYDQIDITSSPRQVLGRAGLMRENGLPLFDADVRNQLQQWGDVNSRPANLSALAGSETIQNSLITIASGALNGIGTGNGTAVANSLIQIDSNGNFVNAAAAAGNGTSVANDINRGSLSTIAYPAGGTYALENTITGAIQIRLPGTIASGFNTMVKFQVDIYDYNDGRTVTYDVGGYVYSSGPSWINCSARAIGGGVGSVKPIRFARTGGTGADRFCLVIGDVTTGWAYPKVQVSNLIVGYTSYDIANWRAGWNIDLVTTLPTTDIAVLNPTAGDTIFGINALETWNGAVATLPNFKTIQGTAAAIVGQGSGATANTLAQLDATAAAQLSSAVNGAAQSVARSATIEKVLNNNASVSIDAASAIFSSGGGATYTLQLKIREVGGTDVNVGSAASVAIAASESDYLQVSGSFTNTSGGTRRYQITCALTKVGAGTAVETQSQSYLRA